MTATLKLFSVRDLKAATYGQLISLPNRAVAMRTFQEWTRNPDSFFAKYPNDFELFELGELDQVTGRITVYETPDYVVRAADLLVSSAS